MTWKIDVPAVRKVLDTTDSSLSETEGAKDDVATALEAVEASLPGECADIVSALSALRRDTLVNDMTDIMTRGNNAVQGTGESVRAFQDADEDMRDRAQARAASIPVQGPPADTKVPANMFNFGTRERTV
ncbi:DUF6507 family protein [Arthrobacter rhombi]|uniref:Uncharacterized protein n=1 Tax=Arthrobacter rhombi TaxID=71253 RepID=A0A1R4FHW6_9MICC|nr:MULTISPECIES: DUF6507 family protein [Micrococcaceae]PCC26409.1 hypothetical protein CIK75_03085 [Glutamicibacter sp. BW78]SJM55545.1 hypothetical protein FM101_04025 [Arthrobacter rhombi]